MICSPKLAILSGLIDIDMKHVQENTAEISISSVFLAHFSRLAILGTPVVTTGKHSEQLRSMGSMSQLGHGSHAPGGLGTLRLFWGRMVLGSLEGLQKHEAP